MTDKLTPVILLGGGTNALSVARSLGSMDVPVYAINYATEYVRHSRYCKWLHVPVHGKEEGSWARFLLGEESERFRDAVLLALSDPALELVNRHRAALASKFLLDLSNADAQERMLNKLATYQQAHLAGVPTPRYWLADTTDRLTAQRQEFVYPLLVKPLFSHVYQKRFVKKFAIVNDFDELVAAHEPARQAGIEVMLVEMIPGPDDRLCSYYTYLDEEGNPQFHFTKRVIRRSPPVMGNGCYHITDWIPEARDLGLKLFQQVGLRGLANVEFKHDVRDGQLKLIEVNARFTAANSLVAASGMDLARFVYNRLTGRPQKPLRRFAVGKRLWYPLEDFHSARELCRRGEMTMGQWLGSVVHPQTLPVFSWSDPMPALVAEGRRIRDALGRRLHKLLSWFVRRPQETTDLSPRVHPQPSPHLS